MLSGLRLDGSGSQKMKRSLLIKDICETLKYVDFYRDMSTIEIAEACLDTIIWEHDLIHPDIFEQEKYYDQHTSGYWEKLERQKNVQSTATLPNN